ncbi:MAG: hypothetical protein JOY84_12345 [Curvibacter sp.]|nr:hypothetical protein [Curvibacter sp.]
MADTWMITAGGAEHHLAGVGMAVNRFEIQSIAHALAQINRFIGHAVRPYSVAEHSLLCCTLAAREGLSASVQLACLLHDAHEAFIGDVASPVKWSLPGTFEGFEKAHALQLRRWYGLQSTFAAHRAVIRHLDLVALATERRDLTLWSADRHEPWAVLDTPGAEVLPAADSLLEGWRHCPWTAWRDRFVQTFHTLRAEA